MTLSHFRFRARHNPPRPMWLVTLALALVAALTLRTSARGETNSDEGSALVASLIREPVRSAAWMEAADTLELIAPKVHPHVLTILLNDDRAGAERLAAARALIDLGADGEAALPALRKLWCEPTHHYKQADVLQAMHAVAPHDPQVSQLILAAARGDLDRVLCGAYCRTVAADMVVSRDLPDDAINEALVRSLGHAPTFPRALQQLSQRAQQGKAPAGKVALVYVALIQRDAKAGRTNPSVYRELVALGEKAESTIPALRALRTHPSAAIRREASDAIGAIQGTGSELALPAEVRSKAN